ncbi:MAG: sulfatase-like hydrolase/transferase [Hyphomicrobiaceae bacterium]
MVTPRNLLFLLSDNHARGYLGAYGHPDARMPNLDRLAVNGVRFDNAYSASPLCCPARAAIATGRYPHQTGIWDNAIVYEGQVASWMHRLRETGHPVVSVGKLHFRESTPANGFSEEILPMHILNGKGGVHMLLRGLDDEPPNRAQWDLYASRSGLGEAPYQPFDRKITEAAVDWLRLSGARAEQPWVLFVSYPSPHPPFSVPAEFYNLFDEARVTLPSATAFDAAVDHPAIAHFRQNHGSDQTMNEAALRRVVTGYLGLLAHLDFEIGKVLTALSEAGLEEDTRVVYTSDHGEMCGHSGLFGKCCLYEGAIGVPLIMSGPDMPSGRVVKQVTSHVDLFPTILECTGVPLSAGDHDLPGISLWPAIADADEDRVGFAEFHAAGSKSGMFMLREGDWKLIYHVGMAPQLFDLKNDPDEMTDLGADHPKAMLLETRLREICDPEAIDAKAKADQRKWIDRWGGKTAILDEGSLIFTPPPGGTAELEG